MGTRIFTLLALFAFSSCVEVSPQPGRVSEDAISGGTGCPVGLNCTTDGGTTIVEIESDPKVEMRHLVEPKVDDDSDAGTYLRKLTVPKNYDGYLYLAGINMSSLADKFVKVRFNFGTDRSPIIIDATVGKAAGLTPQTDIDVLILDMKSKPFNRVSLIYDLYDYNDYDFFGSVEATALEEPVQFNRDKKLYCRGLKLEDDDTFDGDLSEGCSQEDDVCKHTYVKVVDQGLVENGVVEVPMVPTYSQVDSDGIGYYSDNTLQQLSKCLPDAPAAFQFDDLINFTIFGEIQSISLVDYIYRGPYRPINEGNWEVFGAALSNAYGVFRQYESSSVQAVSTATPSVAYNGVTVNVGIGLDVCSSFSEDCSTDSLVAERIAYGFNSIKKSISFDFVAKADGATVHFYDLSSGYESNLFPIQTKLNLSQGVEHLSRSTLSNPMPALTYMSSGLAANGESDWMDGCNARATSRAPITGEHVGSCNLSASIEILVQEDDGSLRTVDSSNEIKLQLVKPSALDTNGEDVLLSSFNSCSSTSECGSSECCFNGRCWSDSIVSQCVDESSNEGNKLPGDSCASDLQCASLCCNSGTCQIHDTLQDPPVYCSKPSGLACIAKEWCAEQTVRQCFVVKTGLDNLGNVTCAKRCFSFQEHGDCQEGTCVQPETPPEQPFVASDPNRCDIAIDPSEIPFTTE